MAVKFVTVLVPEKFFAGEAKAILGLYAYSSAEFPYLFLVVIVGRIRLYMGFHMELLVELLYKDALIKCPFGIS